MARLYISIALCFCLLTGVLTGCSVPFLSDNSNRSLIFTHWDTENQGIYEALAREYMENNPGMVIHVEAIQQGEYTGTWEKNAADRNIADVFAIPGGQDFETYINSGKLLNLSRWEDVFKSLNPGLLQLGTKDAFIGAVPVTGTVPVVFYNETLYRQLGLVLPKNLSDFIINCGILQSKGIIPFAMSKTDDGLWDAEDLVEGILANSAYGSPLMSSGKFLDENEEIDSGIYDMVGLAAQLADMNLMILKEESPRGRQALLEQFARGAYAMIPGTSDDIRELHAINPDFHFAFFTMPGSNGSYTGVLKARMMLGISASSKVTADAKGFIGYLLSSEAQAELCNGTQQIPVIEGVALSDSKLHDVQKLLYTPDGLYPSLLQRISNGERAVWLERIDSAFSGKCRDINQYMLDWVAGLKAVN